MGKYSGFKSGGDKIHYKLEKIGDDNNFLKNGDYLALQYTFCEDSKCNKNEPSEWMIKKLDEEENESIWTELRVGDRIKIILDSGINEQWINLLKLEDKKYSWPIILRMDVQASVSTGKFVGKRSAMELLYTYREEQELLHMMKTPAGETFVDKNGAYVQITKMGKGDTIQFGKEVCISYQAFFSNGIKFDDTDNWADTLKISFGSPLQIIQGLEYGIDGMRDGTEAKIIIPSRLGFGEKGSSSGIVPPFEPLLYQVKIISVKEVLKNENE